MNDEDVANAARLEILVVGLLAVCLDACGPSSGGQSGTDSAGAGECDQAQPIRDSNHPIGGYGASANDLYSIVEGEWLIWHPPIGDAPECIPMTISIQRGAGGVYRENCGIDLDAQVTVEAPQYELVARGSLARFGLRPPGAPSRIVANSAATIALTGTANLGDENGPTAVNVEVTLEFQLPDPSYGVWPKAHAASTVDSLPWSVEFRRMDSCATD